MNIDNQKEYWDKVAQQKTFTHPINIDLLLKYVTKTAGIVDYGCGYGRIVHELLHAGFSNVNGYDTSVELINRGTGNQLPLHHISDPGHLPLADNSVDCFILFAVLTCIPSNEGQTGLMQLLHSKLKPGGYIYISDYYLQNNEVAKSRYTYFNDDKENYGVFTLPEGATLRHHTREWIATLISNFEVKEEQLIEVKTMNGNSAEAFQLIVRKDLYNCSQPLSPNVSSSFIRITFRLNMNSKKHDVALLVHTCDRYEFLYEGFYYFFKKYWDHQINCNCYFATEEKKSSIPGFKNIQSGKGEWADRLAYLLKNEIKENYVLYFQEDMWLNKTVNPHFFNQLFSLAKQHNWQQVKLHSSEVYKTIATNEFIEGFNIVKLHNETSDFLMSHQVTLWDKDFLLQQLHKGEHPWRNERKGTKRLKKLNPEIYHADYFAENGKGEINKNSNPVLRSEYQTISNNATLNNNVKPYIQDLMNGDAAEIKYAETLQYHLANEITHDGKQKPRKEDIFKKIKNKLQGK